MVGVGGLEQRVHRISPNDEVQTSPVGFPAQHRDGHAAHAETPDRFHHCGQILSSRRRAVDLRNDVSLAQAGLVTRRADNDLPDHGQVRRVRIPAQERTYPAGDSAPDKLGWIGGQRLHGILEGG